MDYIVPVTQDATAQFRDKFLEAMERPESGRDGLWTLLKEYVVEARDTGETAERFVVRVKRLIEVVTTERGGADDSAVQRLKQDVVTKAIKAYYMQ
jgi:hypothetical protein